jgi:hypothetical protein
VNVLIGELKKASCHHYLKGTLFISPPDETIGKIIADAMDKVKKA